MKGELKNTAINLRREGLTYSEILKHVPVAKSTLSIWLRSVNLSRKQFHRLTVKKMEAAKRGGEFRKKQRIAITEKIKRESILEINSIVEKELFLIGLALYWAEGSKNKEYAPSSGVIFSNSDPLMNKIFLKWLINCIKIPNDDVYFEIYIHELYKERVGKIKEYWANVTGLSKAKFDKIYLKRNSINTNRKNLGENYFGLLRIKVRKSTNLNRKIAGWIEGICIQCGVV